MNFYVRPREWKLEMRTFHFWCLNHKMKMKVLNYFDIQINKYISYKIWCTNFSHIFISKYIRTFICILQFKHQKWNVHTSSFHFWGRGEKSIDWLQIYSILKIFKKWLFFRKILVLDSVRRPGSWPFSNIDHFAWTQLCPRSPDFSVLTQVFNQFREINNVG